MYGWQARAVLLHSATIDNPDPIVLELPAVRNEHGGDTQFILSSTGKQVTACDVPRVGKRSPSLYFPCHVACVKIAKIVASSTSQNTPSFSVLQGMQRLWKVLVIYWEAYIRVNQKAHPIQNLANAGAYGDLWHHQELEWHSGGNGVEARLFDLLVSCETILILPRMYS